MDVNVVKEVIQIVEETTKEIKKLTENKNKNKERRINKISKRNEIMIIGDSIVHNMDVKQVEETVGPVLVPGMSGPEAKFNRAYGSKYDCKAKFPNNNYEYKVPQLLQRDKTRNLIFQASVTDLSNLKEVPKSNTNYLYDKATESENAIKTAKASLDKDSDLEKVVVMERPPRDDSMYDLNEWANFVLRCQGEEAREQYGDRLVVGRHTNLYLEDGASKVAIYGEQGRTFGYDGVHMRGVEGKLAYTKSVIDILKKSGLESLKWKVVGDKEASNKKKVSQEVRRPVTTSNRFSMLN
jgi:hypothetical protein